MILFFYFRSKLRTIAASASNTWGLFWLVLLLGYGLVEVPRSIWYSASTHHLINHAYFKVAKLYHERAEAEDHVNDLLQVNYYTSIIVFQMGKNFYYQDVSHDLFYSHFIYFSPSLDFVRGGKSIILLPIPPFWFFTVCYNFTCNTK